MDRNHNLDDPLVDVRGISKVYFPSPPLMRLLLRSSIRNPVQALDGVSLQVRAGEILAVVGPNGAGKSTLFRILTGLTVPSVGSARISMLDVSQQSAKVRRLVGFSPADDRTLLLRHTCRENLLFHGRMQGVESRILRGRIDETLDLVGLGEAKDRVGFALSSGMRSRLQLARAWLHRPRVLILDEPTSSVDPLSASDFLEITKKLATEDGVAVLISSHRLEEIESLRDRVLLLDQGRIIFNGDLETLRQQWQRPEVTIRFSNGEAASRAYSLLNAVTGTRLTSSQDATITIETNTPTGELLRSLESEIIAVESVVATRASLIQVLKRALEEGRSRQGEGR